MPGVHAGGWRTRQSKWAGEPGCRDGLLFTIIGTFPTLAPRPPAWPAILQAARSPDVGGVGAVRRVDNENCHECPTAEQEQCLSYLLPA